MIGAAGPSRSGEVIENSAGEQQIYGDTKTLISVDVPVDGVAARVQLQLRADSAGYMIAVGDAATRDHRHFESLHAATQAFLRIVECVYQPPDVRD